VELNSHIINQIHSHTFHTNLTPVLQAGKYQLPNTLLTLWPICAAKKLIFLNYNYLYNKILLLELVTEFPLDTQDYQCNVRPPHGRQGCYVVQYGRQVPKFWKTLLSPSSDEPKQVTSCSYGILVPIYWTTTHCNNQEHKNVNAGILLCKGTGTGATITCALYIGADWRTIRCTHYL